MLKKREERKKGWKESKRKEKIKIQIKDPRHLSLELKSAVYLYPSPFTFPVQPGKRALDVCDTATKITWNNVLIIFLHIGITDTTM